MKTVKVGVLGGGQLGQMLALAGYPLGIDFSFLDPNANAPASKIGKFIHANYDDPEAIKRLAENSDVLTFDMENVSADCIEKAGVASLCRPNLSALKTAQDRLKEKVCFESLGIEVAPYRAVDTSKELMEAIEVIGLPALLKTRRFGYDGRGQRYLQSISDAEPAFTALGKGNLILESVVAFDKEVSLLGARSPNGEVRFYPLAQNHHVDGVLRVSITDRRNTQLQELAKSYVGRILDHFAYIGVLAVEFFSLGDKLIANEMAPRVHNSGHWSIEGSISSQFENHVRAITDLPLGETSPVLAAAMVNFIGKMPTRKELLSIPGLHLHDYSKSPRPGRKLGHATLTGHTPQDFRARLYKLIELAGYDQLVKCLKIG